MQVILTEPAEQSLQEIFNYYSEEVSKEVAHKIKDQILYKVNLLETFPNRGRIEDSLKELKLQSSIYY